MTALDQILQDEPDDGAPERMERETTFQYMRRWWFYWSTKAAKKQRDGFKASPRKKTNHGMEGMKKRRNRNVATIDDLCAALESPTEVDE